jgi:predicted aspartyl protease
MRTFVVWLGLLALSHTCLAVDNDRPDLKSLYDAHRWFALRDAVHKTDAPLFYRGAVACVFNDVHQCEKKAKAVIGSQPHSEQAHAAHSLLTAVYLRYGQYRKAFSQVDEMLVLEPDDSDAKSVRTLLAALSSSPDQSIGRRHSARLSVHHEGADLGVPVSINGTPATYTFDTGANLSLLSESEAKRLGLAVRDVESRMEVMTGARVSLRIAVASELAVGAFRLKNVAFLVFPDDQPPFNDLPLGERGIIGISVLLAFQSFSWGSDGSFEISAPPRKLAHSDLCFDGQIPIAEVQFESRSLSFSLDTGAEATYLYPPFAAAFPDLVTEQGKRESKKVTGVSSSAQVESSTLPKLQLDIGGFTTILRPAQVLLAQTTAGSKLFDGNLGMDLLTQAQRTTLDFRSMTLTLQ